MGLEAMRRELRERYEGLLRSPAHGRHSGGGTPQRREMDLFSDLIDEAQADEFKDSRKFYDLAEEAGKLEMPEVARELADIGRAQQEHYRRLEEVIVSVMKVKARRGLA